MELLVFILTIVLCFLCPILIGLILLQGGAGDLSSSFGGGGALDSTLGVGAGRKMSKLTGWLGFAFLAIVTVLAMPRGNINETLRQAKPDDAVVVPAVGTPVQTSGTIEVPDMSGPPPVVAPPAATTPAADPVAPVVAPAATDPAVADPAAAPAAAPVPAADSAAAPATDAKPAERTPLKLDAK